jgi:hypothetical protein
MPDTHAGSDDAAGDAVPAGAPSAPAPVALSEAEMLIARAAEQAAPDEADQVDLAAPEAAPAGPPSSPPGRPGSEDRARDEERLSANGAREPDVRPIGHDHDGGHDHRHDGDAAHDHGPRRQVARRAGPIMMVVALGWLARQFLKRPRAGKSKRR